MQTSEKERLVELLRERAIRACRDNLLSFSTANHYKFECAPFHEVYYTVLNLFAYGRIKKLIITMPPQHGKSSGSSRMLPAYMLGINPNLKIGIGSYAATHAEDFNRDIQKILDSELYQQIFPETRLNSSNIVTVAGKYLRNSKKFEIVNKQGYLFAAGRGGALTGKSIDVMILDDVYKDYEEANSPTIREKAWNWYTTVVKTRLHNNSQELIVFTRWHEDDLIGRIGQKQNIIEAKTFDDVLNAAPEDWIKINFEAIKTGEPTELDPREPGAALWEDRHSIVKLREKQELDRVQFDCLYQGAPDNLAGRLYTPFRTYENVTDIGTVIGRGNVTDPADSGGDMTCSICYDKVRSNEITNGEGKTYLCVTDIVYTEQDVEQTPDIIAAMLNRNNTRYSLIESNFGGRAYAILVRRKTRAEVRTFHQSGNKESRVMTNAGLVTYHILFPVGWETRFPQFYEAVTKFKRKFTANKNDDAPDMLTLMIEKEILNEIDTGSVGIKRRN